MYVSTVCPCVCVCGVCMYMYVSLRTNNNGTLVGASPLDVFCNQITLSDVVFLVLKWLLLALSLAKTSNRQPRPYHTWLIQPTTPHTL